MYVYVLTSNFVELVYCVDWTTLCDHRMGLSSSDARYLWSKGVGYFRNGPNGKQ